MHAGEELSTDASTEDVLDAEWLCDLYDGATKDVPDAEWLCDHYEFAFLGNELSPPSAGDTLDGENVVHNFGACLCGCSDHLWAEEAREPWLPRNLDLPRPVEAKAANPSWRRRL